MNLKDLIKFLKIRLNEQGEKLDPENENFGPASEEALSKYEIEITLKKKAVVTPPAGTYKNPAYEEAKKYSGKKETDKTFGAWLSGYWKKVGLANYKTIVGSSFAWCALFFYAMNSNVGQDVIASAGAKRIGQSGYEINWKANGIPQGAGVWKNSKDCSSSAGNHITWADGDCSAEDLAKKGATWPGFGGNQGDQVKRSIYCAKGDCGLLSKDVICRVFWHDKNLPPKVTKSKNCTGSSSQESTQ